MGDGWTGAWCAEHGEIDRVDEDGCCPSCGGSAVGEGAERALKLTSVLEKANRATKRRGMERDAARAAHEMFERKFIKAERARIAAEAELAAVHADLPRLLAAENRLLEIRAEVEGFADEHGHGYTAADGINALRAILEPQTTEGGEHG